MPTRVFTGLKPTGRLQLGNHLGAVRPLLDLAAAPAADVLVCVADLHALTVDHDPARLRALTRELATTLLACGLDPSARLFVQSSVPAHTELAYLLECTATHGEMTRMVQFKEKSSGSDSIRLSLLTYPALMAADILAHDAEVVPVGEDQRQHLELTTTLARRFNARYGETFVVPRATTPPATARLKDLRDPGAKMGKTGSDGSGVVFLLDDPDTIVAKVRRAVTDAEPALIYDSAERPGVANIAALLGALTGREPAAALDGLPGSGALKRAVIDALVATLDPVRRRYAELAAEPTEVDRVLAAGRDAVAPPAAATVARAREAMGLLRVG
ncbi:tryptophan--tRNA ligase [Cellulomonas pakistanensis]|uniref:Tryptophan--tRNA ligase n=1 Tax=Cellulomonas pakistanensis TaxID=992287 RepID=A0A919U3N5_9CELL|nr:tryptophan--tRNA ligase [Cellulomonas pakistanensis]GIG36506.1 tryptophan--tRNA ligase 1 [Cellulomonas pakistanensis]